MTKDELKPIDTSKYKITETGQVLKMTKDEMKNRISMAFKDPVLQQGFEIICKENTELKKQIEKMKCCTNCKHNEIIEGEEFCHASRGVCKYYSEIFEDDNWELM